MLGVAVSSSNLYWTISGVLPDGTISDTLVEAGLDGNNPQVIATGQGGMIGVAVSEP